MNRQEPQSIGRELTRRSLLGASGSMAWILGSCPVIAQRLLVTNVTERRATMDIKRNGSRPSGKGPEAYFTGTVRIDPMFQVGDPARVSAGHVTFEPGARSAWHTHPLGQTLIVTSGLGWAQSEGGPSKKSVLAMSSGFHQARSTGMARLPPPQ